MMENLSEVATKSSIHLLDCSDEVVREVAGLFAARPDVRMDRVGAHPQRRIDRKGAGVLIADGGSASSLAAMASLLEEPAAMPALVIVRTIDFESAIRAFRAGVSDLLERPLRAEEAGRRIDEALEVDRSRSSRRRVHHRVGMRVRSLTPREKEVMSSVVHGSANRRIAVDLGISEKTVEVHRRNVMRKMEAESLAELVRQNVVMESIAGRA